MANPTQPSAADQQLAAQLLAQTGNGGNISPQLAAAIQAGAGGTTADPATAIQDAIAQAALETSGVNLWDYAEQPLPSWVPSEIRTYAQTNPSTLSDYYNPYFGSLQHSGDEQVYMGGKHVWMGADQGNAQNDTTDQMTWTHEATAGSDEQGSQPAPPSRKVTRDKTQTVASVVNAPYTWSDEKIQEAMKRFRQAGVNVSNFDQLVSAWGNIVQRAAAVYDYSNGQRKVTPWDVLDMTKREAQSAGSYTNYENGSHTTTSTSVADISQGDAWQALQGTLQSLLGRDPSHQEVRDFAYRMNQVAAQNPTVTHTTTNYQGGNAVSQSRTTQSGFDSNDLAQAAYGQAQDDPNYGAFQAATTYFNATQSALAAL